MNERVLEDEAFWLSSYATTSHSQAKKRYEDNSDWLAKWTHFLPVCEPSTAAPTDLQPVESSDIAAYLVQQTSYMTTKLINPYKHTTSSMVM